jgi:hypothetical protein
LPIREAPHQDFSQQRTCDDTRVACVEGARKWCEHGCEFKMFPSYAQRARRVGWGTPKRWGINDYFFLDGIFAAGLGDVLVNPGGSSQALWQFVSIQAFTFFSRTSSGTGP